ncbi:MAG: 30S ribosomal protein S4e [Candidatus Aenigmatarchaeota archaeon]
MVKLKRLSAPEFWKVPKKKMTWVVVPSPGPHKKFECIPLTIVVRDVLGLAEKGKEAKSIIKKGDILVDGKPRKDPGYPAGLMDVISIPKMNKNYRIIPFAKGLKLVEISENEAKKKILRIRNKRILRNKKIQLNFHDGKNLFVEKDVYKVGDSVLVELPSLKIIDHFKLEKGATGLILKGKNAGKLVKIVGIVVRRTHEPNKIVCETEGKNMEIIFDYLFVVGREAPAIKVSE